MTIKFDSRTKDSKYSVYRISCKETGKCYYGITAGRVETRLSRHVIDAFRRRGCRIGSLQDRIRKVHVGGQRPRDAFEVEIVAERLSLACARSLESHLVEEKKTRVPHGFNVQPGGFSAGSKANSKPLTVSDERGYRRNYSSLMKAVDARNRELAKQDSKLLKYPTVRARIREMGWTIEEALEYKSRIDGRSRREPFLCSGTRMVSLAQASQATGLTKATLRSRLHRAKLNGRSDHDIAEVMPRPDVKALSLPDPDNRRRLISATAVARKLGIPVSTVVHRYRRAPKDISSRELINWLIGPKRPVRVLMLDVPGGERLCGSIRQIYMEISRRDDLESLREEHLSLSGVTRRLRSLDNQEAAFCGKDLAWAFGFAARTSRKQCSMNFHPPGPRRKLLRSSYDFCGLSLPLQRDFVAFVLEIIECNGLAGVFRLRGRGAVERHLHLQKVVSAKTK